MRKTIQLLFFTFTLLFSSIGVYAQMSLEYNTNLANGRTISVSLFGTVDVIVDWGDGYSESFTTYGDKEHTYAVEGVYIVNITGNLTQFGHGALNAFAQDKLVKVLSFGNIGLTSISGAFYGSENLIEVPASLPSSITDISYAFRNTGQETIVGLDSWDVSNVTNMSNVFMEASSFNQDIGSWVVDNVTTMESMFLWAQNFNQDISNWNVGQVITMNKMFDQARAFNQDINGWNVSNVTNMYGMFQFAVAFNQDLNSWDVSKVTDMMFMFGRTDVFNGNISSWNTGMVITMESMFSHAKSFNQNISSWDVSKVTTMANMFTNADSFNQDISTWDVSKVTDMSDMFSGAEIFNQPVHNWVDIGAVRDMSFMFAWTGAFNQALDWDVSQVTSMGFMFKGTQVFNQDISGWDVGNVLGMSGMFTDAIAFNQDLSTWDVSSVSSMYHMFEGATSFDQDIGAWNVTNVRDMRGMFNGIVLSEANYNNILIAWAALDLYNEVRFDAGLSQFSEGAAADARAAIIANDQWTINDGGVEGSYIWSGTAKSSSWNVPANWSDNTVPTPTDHVVIPELFGGSDVFISSGNTGDCYNLQVNSDAILNIESGASLINRGTITNNGTVNVKRIIPDGEWHLISSPNDQTTANTFLGEYLQNWNETTATWTEVSSINTTLNVGKGYSLWGVAKATSYTFTGTPNTGELSTTITYTDNCTEGDCNDGANLLGNPYPSSIDWDGLDETWGAVYIWNPNYDNGNGTFGKYVSWVDGTGIGTQYIAPMQGFFIVAESEDDGNDFTFDNLNRTHEGANSFYKSDNSIQNGLIIAAFTNNATDEVCIKTKSTAAPGFDKAFDAYKFLSNISGVSELYTISDGKLLSIDSRPEIDLIQLGFRNSENGTYRIGIQEIEGISKAEIEDTKLNKYHDLSNGAYEFDWLTSDSEERFILHLQATGIEDEIGEQVVQVYGVNGKVFVSLGKSKEFSKIYIFDLSGRLLFDEKLTNQSLQNFELGNKNGAYLVQLLGENDSFTQKIIL